MKKETGIRFLFLLCWCSYFCAYIGRLNYSAALTDMIQSEGFGKGEAGLIGTAFFFAYGAGQFVSGFLGDRLPAKWLVFMGLFCSSICNLLMSQSSNIGIMIGVWCVNGLVQALIWSPMLRLVTDYCKAEVRPKLCAALNSAVPVGTMAAYGVTAAVWLAVCVSAGGRLPFHHVACLAVGHHARAADNAGAGKADTSFCGGSSAAKYSRGHGYETRPDFTTVRACTAACRAVCAGGIEGRRDDVDSSLYSGDLRCQSDSGGGGNDGDTAVQPVWRLACRGSGQAYGEK